MNQVFYLLEDNHGEHYLFQSRELAFKEACSRKSDLDFEEWKDDLDELEDELMMDYDMTIEPITFYDDEVE